MVILPVIQAGQFNIREEEACLSQLFDHLNLPNSRDTTLNFRPLLDLTSGYFGLFKSYKDRILRSRIRTRILCASPKVRFLVPSNMANSSMSFFLGEWFLWFQRNIQPSARGLHMARAAIHGCCAFLSNSRSPVHPWIRGAQRMEQVRLDLPCERCGRCFLPFMLELIVCLIYCRHLAFTKSRVSTNPHTLWFHKPQLALCPSGHRTVFCNARKFCDRSEEASARGTRPEKIRRRLERRPEKCAAYHKNSSSAFERIPISSTLRYPNSPLSSIPK